jgi:hypothetical protein
MKPELFGPITLSVLLVLRLIVPVGLALLAGSLVERYQATHKGQ